MFVVAKDPAYARPITSPKWHQNPGKLVRRKNFKKKIKIKIKVRKKTINTK